MTPNPSRAERLTAKLPAEAKATLATLVSRGCNGEFIVATATVLAFIATARLRPTTPTLPWKRLLRQLSVFQKAARLVREFQKSPCLKPATLAKALLLPEGSGDLGLTPAQWEAQFIILAPTLDLYRSAVMTTAAFNKVAPRSFERDRLLVQLGNHVNQKTGSYHWSSIAEIISAVGDQNCDENKLGVEYRRARKWFEKWMP